MQNLTWHQTQSLSPTPKHTTQYPSHFMEEKKMLKTNLNDQALGQDINISVQLAEHLERDQRMEGTGKLLGSI